jgi:hypothetical protein
MANSEKLIGTTEHVTLYMMCRLNRRRYNRVWLYFQFIEMYKHNAMHSIQKVISYHTVTNL